MSTFNRKRQIMEQEPSTQDEIIDLATEAGLAYNHDDYPDIWDTYMNVGREEIMAFAKLVAAKAIAELESQEPVGVIYKSRFAVGGVIHDENKVNDGDLVYTRPPQRTEQEPVGRFAKFTDGIWREVTDGSPGIPLYKEKNT